jgi:hypothetical protein
LRPYRGAKNWFHTRSNRGFSAVSLGFTLVSCGFTPSWDQQNCWPQKPASHRTFLVSYQRETKAIHYRLAHLRPNRGVEVLEARVKPRQLAGIAVFSAKYVVSSGFMFVLGGQKYKFPWFHGHFFR